MAARTGALAARPTVGHWATEPLEEIAEAVIVVDRALRITYANPAARELLAGRGTCPEGKRLAAVLRLADEQGRPLPAPANPFARALREGRPIACTAEVARPDGARTLYAFSVAPMRDEAARPTHAIGLLHDCSREREAERLKAEFVSMASHEIRTPLAALQGFTELLLSREVPSEVQRDWLRLMNREAVRLAGVIEELLDLTRIEAGHAQVTLGRVRVREVVRRVVRLLDDGGRVRVQVEPVPSITADGDKLAQVLTNLLRNALDYSAPGTPVKITVARRCLKPAGEVVPVLGSSGGSNCTAALSVAVHDRGIGMARDEIERAFQPFHRSEASRELAPQGSGLGLAIVKALLERHRASLWVQSAPGAGSVFGFCLPANPQSA